LRPPSEQTVAAGECTKETKEDSMMTLLEARSYIAGELARIERENPVGVMKSVGSLMIADSLEGLGCLAGDIRVFAGCGFA
jgi:hypothetical protein